MLCSWKQDFGATTPDPVSFSLTRSVEPARTRLQTRSSSCHEGMMACSQRHSTAQRFKLARPCDQASVTVVFDNTQKDASPVGYEAYDEINVTRQVRLYSFRVTKSVRGIRVPCCIISFSFCRSSSEAATSTSSTATRHNRTASKTSSTPSNSISTTRTSSSCKAASPKCST